ncbi:MAG: DUF3237 family protein [Lewinellaceae bacterium]|nr:DUF3237 family protein [Lewinellaceae bacterium]
MESTMNALEKAGITTQKMLFSETVYLTGITEYGVSWQELTTGQVRPPLEGARFDIAFAGTLEGAKLSGSIEGVDYLTVRADGRFMLDLHLTVTTEDGEKIAVYEDGQLIPPQDGSGIAQLRLCMQFTTASPKYSWLNKIQAWAVGEVDWNTGKVTVQAYQV